MVQWTIQPPPPPIITTLIHHNYGRASKATLTDYVAGARYLSYVHQALGLITLHACAIVAESAMFETIFFRKENLAKKILLWHVSILGPGA